MDDYQNRSYGEIPVGFGEKPGIVVVDFQTAFTDPRYPLGGARWSCGRSRTPRSSSRWRGATTCQWRAATRPT
jgi:hypothetical protein